MIQLLNTITTGDARELSSSIPDNSIDLIFTDPPYIKKHIHLYGWLAEEGARVLKPGGFLLCYVGTYWKYEVLQDLGRHLDFFWDFIALNRGSRPVMWQRHILAGYKSILAFTKGKPDCPYGNGNILDVWVGSGEDKRYHTWGQDESTARYYIACFSQPGAMVLDPFVGGGTTAVLAKQLNRNFIAFEIDPDTANIASKRLEMTQPMLMPETAYQLPLESAGVA
jgi:site-specific DNA-methyltransferase (adenine-specific)